VREINLFITRQQIALQVTGSGELLLKGRQVGVRSDGTLFVA
jgi:hypothetical protein